MSDESPQDQATDGDGPTYELTAQDHVDTQMRHALADALGDQLSGDDDLYQVVGWEKDPSVEQYYARYLRNPYARAVVDLPVETAWRDPPTIDDDEETDAESDGEDATSFEEAVDELARDQRIWHYAKRADKLAGIGEFGLLVLELDDINGPDGFDSEATAASEVTGLRPFSQASVEEYEVGGPGSERWGEPVRYLLDLEDEDDDATQASENEEVDELWVHHTRVIHVPSDELMDDEIRGTPRLEPVYNNVTDIERVLGSAAEVTYRGAAWGLNVNIDPEFNLEDGGDELKEHLERWYYGLEPILRTQGAEDVQSLGGEEVSPGSVIDPNIEAISAQTGLPQSVLKGNETGERATSQDLKEWYGKVAERREAFVTPRLVRELLDRLVEFGVLPAPSGEGYDVEWEPLAEANEDEVATTEKTRAETLQSLPDVEIALTPAEQVAYLEDGTLPNDLDEREEEIEEAQDEMGPLDDQDEEVPLEDMPDEMAEQAGEPGGQQPPGGGGGGGQQPPGFEQPAESDDD